MPELLCKSAGDLPDWGDVQPYFRFVEAPGIGWKHWIRLGVLYLEAALSHA